MSFRAGPRVGKDRGDNNAFQLKAFGTELLPTLEAPFWPLEERGAKWHDECDWIYGTQGSNTIIVDGVRQFSLFDPRFIKGNHHDRPDSSWLSSPTEGTVPAAEIKSFSFSPVADYICGEAANAYIDKFGNKLLHNYTRHILFVKDAYVVVIDNINGRQGVAHDIQWNFHAGKGNHLTPIDGGFRILSESNGQSVRLDTTVVIPQMNMEISKVPARDPGYRSSYVSLRQTSKAVQTTAIFVMDIKRDMEQALPVRLLRNDSALISLSIGNDLMVWNRTCGTVEYGDLRFSGKMVWLRPNRAAILAEGNRLEWRGMILIDEKSDASRVWPASFSSSIDHHP